MENIKVLAYLKDVLKNIPNDWLRLTTHRLDIYNEELAKTEFLEHFETFFNNNATETSALNVLPTAYDYIRLGHPLSCVLEWAIAKTHNTNAENVISFSSKTIPIYAVLRENAIANKKTQIVYSNKLPEAFNAELLQDIYNYTFELNKVDKISDIELFNGSTIYVSEQDNISQIELNPNIDFYINYNTQLGSIILVNGVQNNSYISKIQHVRRRESIAMTPANCVVALHQLVDSSIVENKTSNAAVNKKLLLDTIKEITGTDSNALVASSGLSMQYAIVMGLIHEALEKHPDKAIKIMVPPNCYGGTNDQARRVAASLKNVEVVDLHVDGGYNMVDSIDLILENISKEDAVPYIIAEIPTNPRVEVPNLIKLKEALAKERYTASGENAIEPVFILDQTFCPNTPFLGEDDVLSTVKAISYVSGSKFPSGGKCTAGYCVANKKAAVLLDKMALHLHLCDNEATDLQYEILAEQMPSMIQRIKDAYTNTREFVNFIQTTLPDAKINFVSEELAKQGFTPSVFSLDLPTKGNTDEEREAYKRKLNLKLINLMITKIPNGSKYCVSYGQLKGCYWTIPATSTQGTTKEGDKDYIARVAVAPNLDLELHKKVFLNFAQEI